MENKVVSKIKESIRDGQCKIHSLLHVKRKKLFESGRKFDIVIYGPGGRAIRSPFVEFNCIH